MKRNPPPAQPPPFGLVAWLEESRVNLPLKGVECRFQVTGALASVEVDQIYHQNNKRPLDCTYTFPLPAGAAVYRCELLVNGRVIRAKVEARADARRIYREQKDAGRRAALVETERENIFTLTLGNVQPEDLIVVRFAWFQIIDRSGNDLRLFVPTCPGVRYIPGKPLLRAPSGKGSADDTDEVPDASRITPPRIDDLHPDAAYLSVEGRLFPGDVEGGTLSSPTHPIYVRETAEAVTMELSGRDAVPDRDFVLIWHEPKRERLDPLAWRWTEGEATYALVELRAPAAVAVADDFPQDFYFLVDRSGSMSGVKWQRTCEALHAFVRLLGVADRVWITLFESEYQDFAEAPLPAPEVLADRGFLQMESMGTDGGTELRPAALHVLEQIAAHSAERHTSVVLITDGQVGNDAAILRAFRKAPKVRVHAFGIDTAVNDAFLQALARQQRGGCWLQTPNDDIAGTIASLAGRLRRPVLADLAVKGAWEAGRKTWPDLHAREVVTVTLQGKGAAPLEITGQLANGRRHRFAVALDVPGSEAIRLLWARERIATLLAADQKEEAIALAKEHNLICEGAAFIAWDEAEQVQIAKEEIVQPAMQCREDGVGMAFFSPRPVFLPKGMMERVYVDLDYRCFRGPVSESLDTSFREGDLRHMLHKMGVPESAIESFMTSALSGGRHGAARLQTFFKAAEVVTRMCQELTAPPSREPLDRYLRDTMSGPAKLMFKATGKCLANIERLLGLKAILDGAQAPGKIFHSLIAWIFKTGMCDEDRLEKLEAITAGWRRAPFSAGARTGRWRKLLEETVGLDSDAHAAIQRWLAEPPAAAPIGQAEGTCAP